MSSKGISKDLPPSAPARKSARKEPTQRASASRQSSRGKAAGDGVRVTGNPHEKSNAAPPNFGSWGAASPGLRRGQSGDDVKNLQYQLNAQGAGLKTDGEFGSKTEKALRNFQRRKGMEQDGVAGSDIQKQLEKGLTLPKDKFLSEGSKGSKVRGAQELMNRLGGDLKTDGKFGPKTQEAVKKLQKEHGLKEDGIIGQETLKVLNGKAQGARPAEPKAAEPKPAAPKPAEPKAAEPKPAAPKPAEPKAAEPKPAAPKPVEPKAAEPKPAAPKPAEPKAAEPKPAEPKPAEPKPAQPKPAEPPPAEPKKEFAFLKDNVRQALEKSGKFELLRKLPPEVTSMYDKMTPKAREEAGKQLAGSTCGVSHREAFVTGQAMGTDTFSYMTDKVKEKMAAGTISQKEGEATLKAMPLLRNLSQKQRDAIADMLIMQAR